MPVQACSDTALALLCELLEQPERTLRADGARLSEHADAYRHLLDLGALVPGNELEASVLCPSCGRHSLAPVADPAGGYQGYCVDCGWVSLPPQFVKPLCAVPGQIARRLGAALGLAARFRCESVIDGVLWRLGELEHWRKRRTMFFGCALEVHAAAVKTHVVKLSAPGAEVILTTGDPSALTEGPLGDCLLIPLRAVAHLRKAGFVLENLDTYLGRPSRPDTGSETSLRLLSRRIALIDGESHALSPQVYQFLTLLEEAAGEPLHKRAITDALEMDIDAFKPATLFKRHKPVYETFVAGDRNGRYWIKPEFVSATEGR
jgi:hypothetical protein